MMRQPARSSAKWPLQAVLCALALSPLVASAASATPDAKEIVQRADAIRFPQEGFQVDVTITNASGAGEPRAYRILSKGNERTLVLTTAPAVERGQILLMRDSDLWVHMPSIDQPVRLGLSQKLTGQVANGDLARANFAGDYEPVLSRTDKIDGRDYHVLELTAARRNVTYHKVVYWVDAENFRPHKAEFYARSGKMLKSARYEAYENLGGKIRPTRLVLEDQLRKGEISVMAYRDLQLRELEDHVFTKQYLKRLQ
jgi:outer membrane lipoprotein-sorting protein